MGEFAIRKSDGVQVKIGTCEDPAYELQFLKFIDGDPWGVYGCIECRKKWRSPLSELIPCMGGDHHDLRDRLIEWYL